MTTAPGSRAAEMPRKSSRPAIVVMQVIGVMQRIIQTSNSPPDGQCSQRSVSAMSVYNLPTAKYIPVFTEHMYIIVPVVTRMCMVLVGKYVYGIVSRPAVGTATFILIIFTGVGKEY